MATAGPRHSKEDFARLGETFYDRDILPAIEKADEGKFVAIDIESGAYEVDVDEQAATDRLTSRHPSAQIWLRRVGSRYARYFGGRGRPALSNS